MPTVKLIKYAFLFLLLTAIISCSKTDTEDPTTPTGDAREKLIGNWKCDENSSKTGKASYSITISKDVTSLDGILIRNFFELGDTTYTRAIVDANYITIPQQVVSGWTLKGNGTYNSNVTIRFSYTADDGQTATENVTADCRK